MVVAGVIAANVISSLVGLIVLAFCLVSGFTLRGITADHMVP
jgi:hypothetical protein